MKTAVKSLAVFVCMVASAAHAVHAAELRVMTSGGFTAAYAVDALRNTLLNPKSVAYSDSASGVYIQQQLFSKLGIADQMKGRATMVPRVPVASVVAKGDYQIGFQQVAELLPVSGVTFVGRIPESVQSVTRFAAGIPVNAPHPAEARKLLDFLSSSEVQAAVKATGLDPIRKP